MKESVKEKQTEKEEMKRENTHCQVKVSLGDITSLQCSFKNLFSPPASSSD